VAQHLLLSYQSSFLEIMRAQFSDKKAFSGGSQASAASIICTAGFACGATSAAAMCLSCTLRAELPQGSGVSRPQQ